MIKASTNFVLLLLGHLMVLLAIIGALLPIMPTTPFLILAAFFYSKGSKRLHNWLLNLKHFGPVIREWEAHGIIRRRAKWYSTTAIIWMFGATIIFVKVFLWVKVLLVFIAAAVLTFIWSRPELVSQPSIREDESTQHN